VVTATRTEEQEERVPRSVTVITREEIEEQADISRSLTQILGRTLPEFTPSEQSRALGQELRGRTPSVLIDGVPLDGQVVTRQLRTIAPSAIERIEVVRGPNAIYGADATGGTINIITRPPVEEGLTSTAEVGVDAAAGDAFLPEDSFGNYLRYGLSGATEKFDFRLNLSRDYTGAFFDGGGDRIPPAESRATANNEVLNVLGKAGINFTDEQRLELTVNHSDSEQQELEFRSDPDTSQGEKPEAIEVGPIELEGENEPIQEENTLVNLSYSHDDLLGSQLQVQGYYRDYLEVQDLPGPDDRIVDPVNGGIQQPVSNAEQWGGRLQVDTPISRSANLLWGVDYNDQKQDVTAILSDLEIFEATDGQRNVSIGSLTFVPPYTLKDLGVFAQLRWDLTERLRLDGGARYTNINFSVDDYTTGILPVRDVEGGSLNFDDVVFNLGATYQVTEALNLFASFSQGFSAPDFISILANPPEGIGQITDAVRVTSPVVVDNYELGLRGNWENVQAKISAFFNTSELGQSLVFTETGQAGDATLVRAPERIYGVETTLDWQPSRNWQLGGSLSFQEGENDVDDDGEFLALGSGKITPLTVRAYLENQTTPDWRNRLQLIYVGNRDRAFEDDVDPVAIDDYIVVDLISEVQLWGGTLNVGIGNLFDNEYRTIDRQRSTGFVGEADEAVFARGRTLSINFSREF
jgi:iron complex outermembrane receptor protein